jgi:hypothetical protein
MSTTIMGALGVSAFSACIEFTAFFAIGLAAGLLLARPRSWSSHLGSLAVVGVCGAWMGAESAYLFGRAEWGGPEGLLAASLGAVGLAYLWRRLHPAPGSDAGGRVAIHQSHA